MREPLAWLRGLGGALGLLLDPLGYLAGSSAETAKQRRARRSEREAADARDLLSAEYEPPDDNDPAKPSFSVLATEKDGSWVVKIDAGGRTITTQSERSEWIEAAAREAVSMALDVPAASFNLRIWERDR